MSERTGKVQTVHGLIDPAELGITLPHEHLLLDINPPAVREDPGFEITLENVGQVRRYWHRNTHDARLTSEAEAVAELAHFKAAGGRTVVEVSSIGLERNPEGLRRIAEQTGLHVVMGCGWYVHHYHPPEVAALDEEALAARIVAEIEQGVDGTGIRPGIIGEVGLYWPVHDDEIKSLRAAALAQRASGAPVMIHPGRHPEAPGHAIAVFKEAGGDPGRAVMAHIDRTVFDPGEMLRLAETGCYLEFDLFGQESSYYPLAEIDMPNDATRIAHLLRLTAAGYGDQLLVAQDICHKHGLKRYGGDGYSHIVENVVPIMHRKGMDEAAVRRLLVDNPARILTFR